MDVNGKVCVVTGGASGIGLALCTRFAREGAHVVLSDLNQEKCELFAGPIGAFPVAADVGREEDVANLVARTIERFGRIDLFVSNAGIAIDGGIEVPTDKFRKVMDVNLMSELFAAKHAIPHMLVQGGGYLLNTASAAGLLVVADSVAYTVTQARRDRLLRVAGRDLHRPGHRGERAVPGRGHHPDHRGQGEHARGT